MDLLGLAKAVAIASFAFFVVGLIYHYYKTKQLRFPVDYAQPKGSYRIGVLYSFTVGMLPWMKESTRRHWISYLRGVVFHVGIFTALLVLLLKFFGIEINSLFVNLFAFITGLGAIMGFAGVIMRVVEQNLRKVSTVDDFISVFLVSLFLMFVSLSLIDLSFTTPMYLISAVTLFYAPLGKIRHCLYFFFSRFFFGLHLGRRGIVHKYTEVSYGK
ncbi:hypothetical protein JGI9_00219 [Candidatus Kryptonium thompsonii]|jgi:hypothetical protein|nr:hypothetical protein JGI9_00219 [Candidatus Kryptonium thompsoni]